MPAKVVVSARAATARATATIVHAHHRSPVILHSDRGTQFTSAEYQQFLKDHHILSSMSDVGHCADNAAAKGFFGKLKRDASTDVAIGRWPWPGLMCSITSSGSTIRSSSEGWMHRIRPSDA